MEGNRLISAIGRLDRALARIEHALPRAGQMEAELAALGERHAGLRATAENALARIDRLIAQAEGE